MNELLTKIPTGWAGWVVLAFTLLVGNYLVAVIRDRISKPAFNWVSKTALWLVTSGFRSLRDNLVRDVARRNIEPGSATIYAMAAFLCWCAFSLALGSAAATQQHSSPEAYAYTQKLEKMPLDQLKAEQETASRSLLAEKLRLEQGIVLFTGLLTGITSITYLRRVVVASMVRRFDWELAKALARFSVAEERELRSMFAQMVVYEQYTFLLQHIAKERTTASGPAPAQDAVDSTQP
jgi:hypothetical protein